MASYHDKAFLDYITFGFPIGRDKDDLITCNTDDNHSSANDWPEAVTEFITDELKHGALLGPFDPPHPQYTWSPLLTRPKGNGGRFILDLSYGDCSVNKATCRELYDGIPFTLKLPSLDNLLCALQSLGHNARLFKVDISHAFRHVPIDPADAIHLGIKWNNKFYIDKSLAFGAVHGTAIFQRISNFIRFILAERGFQVWNYIDDIYACCHKDWADEAFHTLQQVIRDRVADNILVALWGSEWRNTAILMRCDNASAVVVCTTGKTRDSFFNFCLREMWFIIAKYNIEFKVIHIKGSDNRVADALSRGRLSQEIDLKLEPVSQVLTL